MEADFTDQRVDASLRAAAAPWHVLWSADDRRVLQASARANTAHRCFADVRHGIRLAGRQPGSTLASALVLGLGVASVAGGFTVVDAFLLRPLPFADPDRLVHVWSTQSAHGHGFSGRSSLPEIEAWAAARRRSLASPPSTTRRRI
jgi:hypothetical protein